MQDIRSGLSGFLLHENSSIRMKPNKLFLTLVRVSLPIMLGLGSSIAESQPPELVNVVAEYEKQEAAIDQELQPTLKGEADRYQTFLAELKTKLDQMKRVQIADIVKNEMKRFSQDGLNSSPSGNTPAEVRSAWMTYLRNVQAIEQKVALKRSGIRTNFRQALTPIEQSLRANKDEAGLAAVAQARASVAIRSLIDAQRYAVTELGGKGNRAVNDIVPGVLVGFEIGGGGWFQFKVLGNLTPLYATSTGIVPGLKRGSGRGERVMAKSGYAVGGLYIRGGEVVNTVQIIFMRVNGDGLSLNPQDFYVSDWLGGEGGGKPKEISGKGRLIVGLTGHSGGVVESIGLIHLK
jgi:hypothetical protein